MPNHHYSGQSDDDCKASAERQLDYQQQPLQHNTRSAAAGRGIATNIQTIAAAKPRSGRQRRTARGSNVEMEILASHRRWQPVRRNRNINTDAARQA